MKTINSKHIALGAGILSIASGLAISSPATAAPRNNAVRQERRDVKEAKQELKQEKRELKQAKKQQTYAPAYPAWNNRPAPRPAWNNYPAYNNGRYDNSDFRQFTGYALANNTSGNLMQVRADNGSIYTVRSTAYVSTLR